MLYLIYRGSKSEELYISMMDTNGKWTGDISIKRQSNNTVNPLSPARPSACVENEILYLFYQGKYDNGLWSLTFDGNNWVEKPIKTPNNGPFTGPVPAVTSIPTSTAARPGWMQKLSGAAKFFRLNLPGTHDSGAIAGRFRQIYANQRLSVADQLKAGIRVLDFRLYVEPSGTSYKFWLCHGNYRFFGRSIFGPLSDALNDCTTFLNSVDPGARKETLVVSLKIDDWNGVEGIPTRTNAIQELGNQMRAAGSLYLLLENNPVTLDPTVADVAGQMVIINRTNYASTAIGLGDRYPDFPDDNEAQVTELLYVQDYHDKTAVSPSSTKLQQFLDAPAKANATGAIMNFGSAVNFKLWGVEINKKLLAKLGQTAGIDRPKLFGWTLFDYTDSAEQSDKYGWLSVIDLIIDSNFGYRAYPETFLIR